MTPSRFVAKGDAPSAQVVGRHGDGDAVAREDSDAELPHLSGRRGEQLVPVRKVHSEHRAREDLRHDAFQLDRFFLHVCQELR